jgi:hypothetical protein
MALPTKTELKAMLRIQSTAEDTLLDLMLARATALVQAHLGRPIETVEDRETIVEEVSACGTQLVIPVTPFDPASVVVTDADDAVVDASTYRVGSGWTGVLRATSGQRFGNPPYRITADTGLATSTEPDYATMLEPLVSQAILDACQDWYQRRNPGAQAEGAGGGVYTQWQQMGLPERVRAALAPLRLVRMA